MLPLVKHKEEVLARIRVAKRIALMSDFDGVLSPIVDDYRKAAMPPRTKMLLRACARKFFVAVISGRGINDLQKRVGMNEISYAGNHGLELQIQGKKTQTKSSKVAETTIQRTAKKLVKLEKQFPGLHLENKRLTLSMHYRMVPVRLREDAVLAVRRVLEGGIKAGSLNVLDGRMLFDIRPKIGVNKGTAARAILRAVPGALPIFIGDDATDEDAFKVLKKGITIHVGSKEKSAARYYVSSRREVDVFLDTLLKVNT